MRQNNSQEGRVAVVADVLCQQVGGGAVEGMGLIVQESVCGSLVVCINSASSTLTYVYVFGKCGQKYCDQYYYIK